MLEEKKRGEHSKVLSPRCGGKFYRIRSERSHLKIAFKWSISIQPRLRSLSLCLSRLTRSVCCRAALF